MKEQRDDLLFLQDALRTKAWWQDAVLLWAIAIAVSIHLAMLSLQFVAGTAAPMATKDVTIAVHLTQEKIQKADFEAQANQQGDGDLKKAHQQTTPIPVDSPMGDAGEQQQQQAGAAQMHVPQQQRDAQDRVLMTSLSWQQQSQQQKRQKMAQAQQDQQQKRTELIASLEAKFAQRQQMYAKQQKIQTLTGVLAKSNPSANYIGQFQQKVERFGNRYYPEAAKQQGLSGDVRLMVVLTPEGGIRAIRLLQSSGQRVLDEAAKDSVRRAMPFGHFDPAMKAIDELRIVRTWRFDAKDSTFNLER